MINNKINLCILFVVFAFVIITNGCNRATQISRTASVENFSEYEKNIGLISNKYNLNMSQIIDPNYSIENNVCKDLRITGKDMEIQVYLSNKALLDEEKGRESFLVTYSISENKNFDLELFTELINSISGKTVSTKFCDDFLVNLNVNKKKSDSSDILFHKSKPLDWSEDWVISYTLYNPEYYSDYLKKLEFVGLTSASE